MQRRAAAVYFVLFVLIGAGAFGFIQVGMSAPQVEFQDAPTYEQGDSFTVGGQSFTVSNVSTQAGEGGGEGGSGESSVVGAIDSPALSSPTSISEGGNVTLNGQQYFAHFPSESTVQLLPAGEYWGDYQQQLEEIDYYQERRNGVWGIVILSVPSAIVLLGAAYMPVK
jgi:hypothetical protein